MSNIKYIRHIIFFIILTFCFGCAKKGTIASGGYNHHFARYGEYNLISKNSDLYMEKTDGTHSKRLTFTPKFKEDFAFIVGNTGYLAYSVYEGMGKLNLSKPNKYYIQNMDMPFKSRKKITEQEFNRYLMGN
ncbi:MAG: hypothetical protein HY810_04415 [Candidatus Omnitrophica bacterium]|nr:hypothetical protein [Candidatus Omnitrophota bacterium]